MMIDPLEVIETLKLAGVRFVLMGAHGIGGWMQQARATRDVDLVVRRSDHKRAVRAIGQKFPELVVDERDMVTRFLDPTNREPVVDLMRPVDLYQHVEVLVRRDVSSRDTGWVVMVQERRRAAVAPVQELRDRLLLQAKLATSVVAVALAGLWGFVIFVLNESPRLRWFGHLARQTSLSPHTHTPSSASLSGSMFSSSVPAASAPPADTQRGDSKAADTSQHESPPGGTSSR